MAKSLEVLANRTTHENLLLAEAAAWLHDMGKCDERLIQQSALDYTGSYTYEYKTAHTSFVTTYSLNLLNETISLKKLIEEGMPRNSEQPGKQWLIRTLGFCHAVAHSEKEEAYYLQKQTTTDTRLGTPFGYEFGLLVNLLTRLSSLPFGQILNRAIFRPEVETAFSEACGETRRPNNEVSLWDWSNIVAALFKSALAGALLGYKETPPYMYWRLLSIRFNGSKFIERVSQIPDLLVRRKMTINGLDKVRQLLEETYLLGTEIYRDEDGSVFIVPNIPDLLTFEDAHKRNLFDRIVYEFCTGTVKSESLQIDGELIPRIKFDTSPWSREGLKIVPQHEHQPVLPINSHIIGELPTYIERGQVELWWQNQSEDICTVCGLRPQGWRAPDRKEHYERRAKGQKCSLISFCYTCKAIERKVCAICEERREDRSKLWATKEPDTTTWLDTIWLDEVADINGRLALIVGKFDLEHWLDGKMLFYPNIRRNLFIESHNVSVVIRNIEKLRAGGYQIVPEGRLSGVADGGSCSIQGQQFKVINVPRRGLRIETASKGAIKLVEEQIIHPGRGMDEKNFQPLDIVPTDTPARLYRVWETTRKFWKGIEESFESTVGKINLRLRIRGVFEPNKDADKKLGDFHAYELKLDNTNLSIVYVGGNEFVTADNLERVAFLLNPTEKLSGDYCDAAKRVFDQLIAENNKVKENKGIQIEEPTGYGNPAKVLGRLRLFDDLQFEEALDQTAYIPTVPILADPQTFFAIVPASKALDVVRSIKDNTAGGNKKEQPGIKEQYENQMGKVHNRLPMTVGIVFASRRTPLPAILDAGRRMLKQPVSNEVWGEAWSVEIIDPPLPRATWPSQVTLTLKKVNEAGEEAKGSDADQRDVATSLSTEQQELSIAVRTVMGDLSTPDEWFPYWHMKSPVPDSWVHICDLHVGDIVYFTPSRFDFQFLETAAQRFEISYEGDKRRGSKHPRRPYYLEELDYIDDLWKALSDKGGLTTTQIHNLIENIEGTRLEWQGHRDQEAQKAKETQEAFEQIVRDALKEVGWKKRPEPDSEEFKRFHRAAISGQLADVVELYMRILKKKPERDQEEG